MDVKEVMVEPVGVNVVGFDVDRNGVGWIVGYDEDWNNVGYVVGFNVDGNNVGLGVGYEVGLAVGFIVDGDDDEGFNVDVVGEEDGINDVVVVVPRVDVDGGAVELEYVCNWLHPFCPIHWQFGALQI